MTVQWTEDEGILKKVEGRRCTETGNGIMSKRGRRRKTDDGLMKTKEGSGQTGGGAWGEDGILKNAEGRRTRDECAKTAWGQTRW